MEKFIELLNEFETPQSGIVFKSYDDYDGTFYGVDCDGETEIAWGDSYICGKRFGFIKWLVENEKIDLEKVEKKFYNEICITDYGDKDRAYGKSDLVISVLSTSDTPIEDLISYLK